MEKVGREFIEKMTEHLKDWNNGSKMQPIALKAAIVLLAVGLQKPSQKSKAKDHQECLAKTLVLWKEGETEKLLRQGRVIQKRLSNSRRVDQPNAARVFANLFRSGQVNSALRTKGSGGPSGVDANEFRRILASKSFDKSGTELCAAIAPTIRRLCTEFIDPLSIEAVLANRLIPLDIKEGAVRLIGV